MTKPDDGLGKQPSRLPPQNLAGAFGSPNRSAGLQGLPPAAPPTASVGHTATTPPAALRAVPADTAATPGVVPPAALRAAPADTAAATTTLAEPGEEAASGEFGNGRQRARRQPSSVPAGHSTAVQQTIVYLPASLRERLRRAVAAAESTYTEVVLDALDAVHPRLPELLRTVAPAGGESLFAPRRPRRLRHAEPLVQVPLRPSRADRAVLDRLVSEYRAPSLSGLVVTALDAYLPPAGGEQ